ncbi:hypothetical protein B0H19DRAFT_1068406 [Mycena capillaripes]|nr:hypothetical protein B0H19DRAFT_1068406 [Mycena capillaripes]
MAVRRGRPPKGAKRNISGLKNQSRQPSLNKTADNSSDSDYSDSEALDLAELDSLAYLEVDSDHSDSDNEANWDEIAQEKFQDCLVALMIQNEEDRRDAGDADWIPSRQEAEAKRSAKRRKPDGRPKEYVKGPDVASKSARTQQRHAGSIRMQTNLDGFLSAPSFSTGSSSTAVFSTLQDEGLHISDHGTPPPTETSNSTPFSTAPPSRAPSPPQIIPRTRSASVLSEPDDEPDEQSPPLIQVDNSDEEMEEDEDPNDWDAVVDDIINGEEDTFFSPPSPSPSPAASTPLVVSAPGLNIRSWHALREKIKGELQKQNLSLIKHNQLLILRNFATLRIKGLKRIAASLEIAHQWHEGNGNWFARRVRALAHHYQVFEELPADTRGGRANAKSLLNDESVQTACLAWLKRQEVGSKSLIHWESHPRDLSVNALPGAGLSDLDIRGHCSKKEFTWMAMNGLTL